jgi:hypothetical protein
MQSQPTTANPSTLQEWASFLTVLNGSKNEANPLLKKSDSAQRIVMHLEKQFSKVEQQPIFRRLGRHTQLVLHFSDVA